jgi:hypothetical protein
LAWVCPGFTNGMGFKCARREQWVNPSIASRKTWWHIIEAVTARKNKGCNRTRNSRRRTVKYVGIYWCFDST